MGHDGCFFLRSSNFMIFGNVTKIRTNSAHRVYNTGHGKIFNNYMEPYALNSWLETLAYKSSTAMIRMICQE